MLNGFCEGLLDGLIGIGAVISVIITCNNVGTEENWISYFSSSNNDLYQTVTHTKYLQDIAQYLAIAGYFFNLLVLVVVYTAVVRYKINSKNCACVLLLTFAASSLLALFSNIAAIVLARIANDQFNYAVPSLMINSLYRSNINDVLNTSDHSSGVYWNALQYELQCCGVYGLIDYQNVTWYPISPAALAPLTCCGPHHDQVSGSSYLFQECVDFSNQTTSYNSQGCYYAVSQYVSTSESVVISTGSFVIAQVVLTIFVRMLYGFYKK